jgi:hypothetical protein
LRSFAVTPARQRVPLAVIGPGEGPVSSTPCPPGLVVRSLAVLFTVRADAYLAVLRRVRCVVWLRRDPVIGSCAT